MIRGMVKRAQDTGKMYVSNTHPRSVPSGFDVEVIHSARLNWLNHYTAPAAREHVTQYISSSGHYPHLSVDTPADLDRIRALMTCSCS